MRRISAPLLSEFSHSLYSISLCPAFCRALFIIFTMNVGYYYRQATNEIYLLFLHDQWNYRNLRPLGLTNTHCFFCRRMTALEIEDFATRKRLTAIPYGDFPGFILDEKQAGVKEDDLLKIISKLPSKFKQTTQKSLECLTKSQPS